MLNDHSLYDENELDEKISEHISSYDNHQKYFIEGQFAFNNEYFHGNDLGDILPDFYTHIEAQPILRELYINSTQLCSQYSSFSAMLQALEYADGANADPEEYNKYCQIVNELSDSYKDSPFDLSQFKKIFKEVSIKNE